MSDIGDIIFFNIDAQQPCENRSIIVEIKGFIVFCASVAAVCFRSSCSRFKIRKNSTLSELFQFVAGSEKQVLSVHLGPPGRIKYVFLR